MLILIVAHNSESSSELTIFVGVFAELSMIISLLQLHFKFKVDCLSNDQIRSEYKKGMNHQTMLSFPRHNHQTNWILKRTS